MNFKNRNRIKTVISRIIAMLCMVVFLTSCMREKHVDKNLSDYYFYSVNGKKVLYIQTASESYFVRFIYDVPADVNSFKVLGPFFGKDNKHIFFKNRILKNVDYATFCYDSINEIVKDKNHVYLVNSNNTNRIRELEIKILQGADPETFHYLKEYHSPLWAKDKNNYYLNNIKLNADYSTLKIFSDHLAYDKDSVFLTSSWSIQKKPYTGKLTYVNSQVMYDDKSVFCKFSRYDSASVIPYKDIKTLKFYDRYNFAMRVDSVIYWDGLPMCSKAPPDAATFEAVDNDTNYKDKNRFYWGNTVAKEKNQ